MGCGGSKNASQDPQKKEATAGGSDSRGSDSQSVVLKLRYPDMETSADVVLAIEPSWGPKGAERFLELVDDGYFDGCVIYRAIKGFMAQWGVNGDTAKYAKWKDKMIQDDPVKQSNTRGRITMATSGPNRRTCQFFINFGNNKNLDGDGFSPFGEVTSGMENVDKIYTGYGEGSGGPNQSKVKEEGNAYLASFPKLTVIESARRSA